MEAQVAKQMLGLLPNVLINNVRGPCGRPARGKGQIDEIHLTADDPDFKPGSTDRSVSCMG